MPNLNLIRVQTKLDELFQGKIDLSDVTNPDEIENKFYTRALAAIAVVMCSGIDYELAAKSELYTLEDLDTALQGVNKKAQTINADMKKASARMKVITGIQNAVADCQTHKAVHDKYLKIGWKARQATFAERHKDELDSFNKAFRYLKKQGVDLNVNLDSLQTEYDKLKATHSELAGQLATVKEELQPMKDIRYWVGKVLTPEQSEVQKKPEPKHSVTERLKFEQEQKKQQPEQKTPQQKKQNMEL